MNTQIRISLQAVPRSLVLLCAILSIFFVIVVISAPGTATLVIVRLLGLYCLIRGFFFLTVISRARGSTEGENLAAAVKKPRAR